MGAFTRAVPPDSAKPSGVSSLRIFLLRFVYLGTFLFVGTTAWWKLFTHRGTWDHLHGVAFSFWAAYATLLLLGLRHPLKLVPLLMLQLFYKLVWLVAVAWPLYAANQLTGAPARLTMVFVAAVVVDLIVIPWPWVLDNLIQKNA